MPTIITERSSFQVQLTYKDFDDSPVTPTGLTYQIHDKEGLEFRPTTVLTPASSVTFVVNSVDTATTAGNINAAHLQRIITVSAVFAADDELHTEIPYTVTALDNIPDLP